MAAVLRAELHRRLALRDTRPLAQRYADVKWRGFDTAASAAAGGAASRLATHKCVREHLGGPSADTEKLYHGTASELMPSELCENAGEGHVYTSDDVAVLKFLAGALEHNARRGGWDPAASRYHALVDALLASVPAAGAVTGVPLSTIRRLLVMSGGDRPDGQQGFPKEVVEALWTIEVNSLRTGVSQDQKLLDVLRSISLLHAQAESIGTMSADLQWIFNNHSEEFASAVHAGLFYMSAFRIGVSEFIAGFFNRRMFMQGFDEIVEAYAVHAEAIAILFTTATVVEKVHIKSQRDPTPEKQAAEVTFLNEMYASKLAMDEMSERMQSLLDRYWNFTSGTFRTTSIPVLSAVGSMMVNSITGTMAAVGIASTGLAALMTMVDRRSIRAKLGENAIDAAMEGVPVDESPAEPDGDVDAASSSIMSYASGAVNYVLSGGSVFDSPVVAGASAVAAAASVAASYRWNTSELKVGRTQQGKTWKDSVPWLSSGAIGKEWGIETKQISTITIRGRFSDRFYGSLFAAAVVGAGTVALMHTGAIMDDSEREKTLSNAEKNGIFAGDTASFGDFKTVENTVETNWDKVTITPSKLITGGAGAIVAASAGASKANSMFNRDQSGVIGAELDLALDARFIVTAVASPDVPKDASEIDIMSVRYMRKLIDDTEPVFRRPFAVGARNVKETLQLAKVLESWEEARFHTTRRGDTAAATPFQRLVDTLGAVGDQNKRQPDSRDLRMVYVRVKAQTETDAFIQSVNEAIFGVSTYPVILPYDGEYSEPLMKTGGLNTSTGFFQEEYKKNVDKVAAFDNHSSQTLASLFKDL